MRYIISKVELIGGVVTHTPVGYTITEPTLPCAAYSDWTSTNSEALTSGTKSMSEFFGTHAACHVIGWCTTCTHDIGLPEITDTSTLT